MTRKPLNRRPSGERLACTTRTSARAWPALAPRFCASGICTQPPLSICRVRVWLQTPWCRKLARARSFTDAKRRGVKAAAAQMEAAAPPEQPLLNARAASAGARWREFPPVPGRSSHTEYLSSRDPEKMRQCRLTMPVSSDIHA